MVLDEDKKRIQETTFAIFADLAVTLPPEKLVELRLQDNEYIHQAGMALRQARTDERHLNRAEEEKALVNKTIDDLLPRKINS